MEESPGINHRPEARGSSAGGHRSGMDGACMEESPGTHHRPEARSHRSGLGGASFGSISTESDVMSSTALEGISIIFSTFVSSDSAETKPLCLTPRAAVRVYIVISAFHRVLWTSSDSKSSNPKLSSRRFACEI